MNPPIITWTPAERLTPEVPDAVRLPAWLNPASLPAPEKLEPIRALAEQAEADFITAALDVCAALRRFLIAENAAYCAGSPEAWDEDAADYPAAVIDAVSSAVGIDRLNELQGWLTGWIGEALEMTDEEREAAYQRLGYPVSWDEDLRLKCNELIGRCDP